MPKPTERLVKVQWIDSHTYVGWRDREFLIKEAQQEELLCESIGYLLYEGEDHIVLAPNLSYENDGKWGSASNVFLIPNVSIKKMEDLKIAKTKSA